MGVPVLVSHYRYELPETYRVSSMVGDCRKAELEEVSHGETRQN